MQTIKHSFKMQEMFRSVGENTKTNKTKPKQNNTQHNKTTLYCKLIHVSYMCYKGYTSYNITIKIKTLEKPQKNRRKTIGKPQKSLRKANEKYQKSLRKALEKHQKSLIKSS